MNHEGAKPAGDLRVTVELGVVLPVTKDGFGNVKPRIMLSDIDPNGDVERQITVGLDTAVRAFARIDEALDQVLSELLAPVTGQPGFKDRLELAERDVSTAKGNIKRMAEKVKSMDADLKRAIESTRPAKDEASGS
jgi:hypothetical protein